MREIFFEVFFSLACLFLNTKDQFLKQKLIKKTKEFWNVATSSPYIAKSRDIALHEDDNVAQYHVNKKILWLVDGLAELVEIVTHLKLVSLSPALTAQKALLRLRVQIMDTVTPEGKPRLAIKTKTSPKKITLNEFEKIRKTIVEYLKTQPSGVTSGQMAKDLKQLARRTIQRYLNDLVREGLINKFKEENFPFSKYGLK